MNATAVEIDLSARIEALEEQNEELREKVREFEEGDATYHAGIEEMQDRIDDLEAELTTAEQAADVLTDAIRDAISDIQTLPEVPLQGVENAIDAIVSELREVL